jgi:type I restriction enzyme R subunit
MSLIIEQQLEDLAITWFQDLGWDYVQGEYIAPDGAMAERRTWNEVLLRPRLLVALRKINPSIPEEGMEQAIHAVEALSDPTLVGRNRAFHKLLLDGVQIEVERHGRKEQDLIRLIDFSNPANNDFLVVNQFTVPGPKMNRRPDLVMFVNGIPLGVLEFKNPADEQADIWSAYHQIQTYKEEIPDLMNTNEVLVISDGITARVGSLTANPERFLPWRAVSHEDDKPLVEFELETLVRGLFDRKRFLDYARHFILFESDDGKLIKKIAGYHQYHAVNEAVQATLLASEKNEEGITRQRRAPYGGQVQSGSKKAGVVWHTQGSGKSITMALYAGKLLQQGPMANPTIVVVTDRNDLDNQLYGTFVAARDLLKQPPEQAQDREDLREKLRIRESGGIIFTTVQKFALLSGEKKHPELSDRHNIVVISDEAHRSQYGTTGRLNTKTGEYVFGYAKHMRDALPYATFIGFTGTPISKEDRDTRAVFGDYVSIYDIQDAVDDGATVPIYYESRLAKLDINQEEIEKLSAQADEIVEDEEDVGAREKAKGVWAQLAALVGAKPRLEEVAADLVQHFETRCETMDGKGMIVCMSRDICVALYDEIVALRPAWHDPHPEKGQIKIIFTGSASDKPHLQPHIQSGLVKRRMERRFKDAEDPLRLVIVRDMWLTGFDAPPCHTMYIDKPMHGHNLMQAIARVNRVFKNKPGGLVVDYIGIAADLKVALKAYVDSQGKGEPTVDTEAAFAAMLAKLDAVRGLFHGFDYSDYETDAIHLLIPAMDHLMDPRQPGGSKKNRFLDAMAGLTRAYALCSTLDEAEEYRYEIAFLSAVRTAIIKHTSVEQKKTEAEKHSLLKAIIDNAVIAEGVDDIFKLAGLEKPNIGLLSENFLEEVRALPQKNFAVALLERLLQDSIKARFRTNVVQETKFSDRLAEALRKYHNRAIETAQVIEELIAMAKDFQSELHREDRLGLSQDEIAFFDALAANESAVRDLGDEILKKIAIEVTEKLRNSTTVDWQKRESVRARLRILVRRTLQKYKYPPEKQEGAVELVLKQAEALADSWTSN